MQKQREEEGKEGRREGREGEGIDVKRATMQKENLGIRTSPRGETTTVR